MPDNDFEEFEREMADVEDPSPFETRGPTESAQRVFELLAEATDLMVTDLVELLNEGRPAICQYLNPRNGVVITCGITSSQDLRIKVQMPHDLGSWVAVERIEREQ